MGERSDEDATAAEIAARVETDCGETVAEGIKQASNQTDGDRYAWTVAGL